MAKVPSPAAVYSGATKVGNALDPVKKGTTKAGNRPVPVTILFMIQFSPDSV